MDILVVDDAPDIRLILSVALRDVGYGVETAVDGQDALKLLRSTTRQPCVILLDLMMPVMDGWAFLTEQQADEALAAIPVIIVSAIPTTLEAAQAAGARAVLRKPLDFDALRAQVAQYCSADA
jgi:CheY-like chemotaxis protein